MNKTRVLLYDIETSPIISYNWTAYESNALEIIEDTQILCFAYKWLGDKKIKVVAQCDMRGYKAGTNNDLMVVKELHRLFNEADIVIAHNGNSFDQKIVQSRMIMHKMAPPSPYKQIDTKNVAKKYGRFSKNNLDFLCTQLGFGHKMENEGWSLWKKVLVGQKQAWKTMKAYNKVDVELLEKLYLQLRPWIENHPSISVIADLPNGCPRCGSENLKSMGYANPNKQGKRKRYQCQSCFGWSQGTEIVKLGVKFIN